MRSSPWLTRSVFAVLLITFMAAPTLAQWEGMHRFSLTVQGSVTSLDQMRSHSVSAPVEIRATVVVSFDSIEVNGVRNGRLRLQDGQVRLDDGLTSMSTSPSGYAIRVRAGESPQLVSPAADLEGYGLDVNELLAVLFPIPAGQALTEGTSWHYRYNQEMDVADVQLVLPVTNTYHINEVRDGFVVVQSTLRGTASVSLQPGHITADHLGSGVLHVDAETGRLMRTAVTVRSTVDKTVPARNRNPEERLQIRTLVTTSAERLPDQPVADPTLGERYVDPAERFSLRLPTGWQTEPALLDRSITLFESPDRTARLYIDIAPARQKQAATDVARTMLDRYARFLVDFSVQTQPTAASLDGHAAAFAEYAYRDGEHYAEGALYSQIDGYDIALQYSADPIQYGNDGSQLLLALSEHFTFGPNPGGYVSAGQLLEAPLIVYESHELAFEIEVPNLWPPIESGDHGVAFVELGGRGRLTIHVEAVAPDESALTLLQDWLRRIQMEQPDSEVVSPAQPAALGSLKGATATLRWPGTTDNVTQRLVIANGGGVLYVLSIEYNSEGFAERSAVFEQMASGFRPLPESARKQALTFEAYNPPPVPLESATFLLIGRLLHQYSDNGTTHTLPAIDTRIDMTVRGERYVSRTDEDGFFYLANLPVSVGDTIEVEVIRGELFDLPYEVNIPVQGITVTAYGPIGLFGELTLALNATKTGVGLHLDSGVDDTTGISRVHQFFLNRYPDSPWAELVRDDLEIRSILSQ